MYQTIEQFYIDADGDDWSLAVMRAQRDFINPAHSIAPQFQATVSKDDARGFTLQFGPREYTFKNSIQLIRNMHLVGSGGRAGNGGTLFVFTEAVNGIECLSVTPAENPTDTFTTSRGDNSIVEQISLYCNVPAPDKHGIVVKSRITLRDCSVTGFGGNGIHISASVTEKTNANNWFIQNCFVSQCAGKGLCVEGSDVNAGCAIALSCMSNGDWAIFDNSFLGNTYLACHVEGNPAGAYHAGRPSADGGSTNGSVFYNCYAEADSPSQIFAPCSVIGGGILALSKDSNAVWLTNEGNLATFPNGLRAYSVSTFDEKQSVIQLGNWGTQTDNKRRVLFLDTELGKEGLNTYDLSYHPNMENVQQNLRGWWDLNHHQNTFLSPLRLSTTESDVPPGQIWFERGFYIGNDDFTDAMVRIKVKTSTQPNELMEGNPGDIILNAAPTMGGFAGWIFVAEVGWRPYGKIE